MRGRVFILGDNIDTDVIAPAGYLHLGIAALKDHALEAVRPDFHTSVRPGDIIIAGRNFGYGSSREQAPAVLKDLGIGIILARSFARIFFRNSINIGLPLGIIREVGDINDGDYVNYEPESGKIYDDDGNAVVLFTGPGGPLSEILEEGGMVDFIRKKLGIK
ncbi:3-isopropylmalate dehydratase [Thermoplasma sp.]|uniref:LeuD/DmdB family oxidoreductase small subunit n=1 Tax=Thermoplasma sp. TaxID=1973142 RepID=UPI0012763BA8|nr:3-isopropylmalate dehydratase [Thermoplasma sp.]KAA8921866.1 MAG: 3-isopropylmalate dehydratase [Thermoplasma sp.]